MSNSGEPKSPTLLRAVIAHPFRISRRLASFGFVLIWSALDYVIRVVIWRGGGVPVHQARGTWLQRSCLRGLVVFDVEIQVSGDFPRHGLLVCNHLSYLDIIVLGAISPAAFVAKIEVSSWPVLGWFARLGGTLFIDRRKRTDAGRAVRDLNAMLASGTLVVLFPEGTSSGGDTVLPFKSSLLDVATGQTHAVTAGFIGYALEEGRVADDVCYWRDMTLIPHLLKLFSKRRIKARVSFAKVDTGCADRKSLARQLHSEVLTLKKKATAV